MQFVIELQGMEFYKILIILKGDIFMEYRFSDRVSSLKPSAIREIFKYAADPSVVSLSAGNPSPDAFPSKEIAEISAKVFAEDLISVLQYSVSEGWHVSPPILF